MIIISTQTKRENIFLFRITNFTGAYVEISNYGASIVSVVVPDQHNKLENIVLRYNNLEDYLSDPYYMGATIGRVANRISNAQFTLNRQTFQLDKNVGNNSNHGGYNGFHQKIFDYTISGEELTLYTISKDKEGGFPGEVNFSVTYSFSDCNELCITYRAESNQPTPINFTNHAYFNLGGSNKSILEDLLWVNTKQYLETNAEFLPTGKTCSTVGTAFDFGSYKKIKSMMPLKQDNLQGYNAYFMKDKDYKEDLPLASIRNEQSGRIIDLYTTIPGVLVYTGDFLSDPFIPFGGICLEAQFPPDGVNQSSFMSNILHPGKIKTDTIKYRFRCRKEAPFDHRPKD
ncbi:aldose epimerase family protein [Bacteroides sp. 224]|uniref:aldose epimerase family protein n=1 Tax=Bacteroides sp. 224 TaxID=2302936 RepID=UPI0013D059FA|nr:aldose epimerase family protein [Bacteroides sp. 224]NDV64270.1 galactose mutarotase [Bacteroides sp. 224]